jgi:hypothetical protein
MFSINSFTSLKRTSFWKSVSSWISILVVLAGDDEVEEEEEELSVGDDGEEFTGDKDDVGEGV